MAGPVRISILADGSQARRELTSTSSSADRMGKALRSAGKVAAVGFGAAVAGATALAAAGVKLAQGAAEDEAAQVKLATSLRNTTGARAKDIAGVEKYISAQGRALGVTDDELRPALGKLAAASGSVAQAQKDVSLALDVAAGRGVKLESVTKALERAQLGNVTSLGKLGVETKDAEGKTRSLEAITADLAKTYRGQASAAAETTAGKYARLKLATDELGESIGARLLPVGEKIANVLLNKAVPAADALWRSFERNGIDGLIDKFAQLTGINLAPYFDDIKRAGENVVRIFEALAPAFGKALESVPPFLQPLQILADVLGFVADVAEAIPGPVAQFAFQAGIAAAVLPLLTRNVTLASTALGTAAGRATLAAGAMARLASAARLAGGVAGVLALSQGFKLASEDATSFGDALKSTGLLVGGGAAVGFSVGGPIGALVGALGGAGAALLGTRDKTKELDSALQTSKQVVADYAGTFDQLTGAITRSTREMALQEIQKAGIISSANVLGISTRELINATLGQGNAAERVREKLNSYNGVLEGLTANKVREFLVGATGEFNRQRLAAEKNAEALSTYRERLQGIPNKVVVALRQAGFPEGKKQVDEIIGRYKLTPREIKTIYRALNVDTTKRQAGDLKKTLEDVGKVAPKFNPLIDAITGGLSEGRRRGRTGARQITGEIEDETGKARPKFGPFTGAIPGALSPARGAASRGGVSIGDALENGVINGFEGTAIRLSNMAAAAVSNAIAAGKRAGKIKSPSRETEYIGKMLGDGLALGMERSIPKADKRGRDLIAAVLAGVTAGSDGVSKALERLDKLIEKRTKDRRGQAIVKGLRDEYAALKDIGRQQDRNTAKLEQARATYRGLIDQAKQYADAVKAGIVANASVVGLGVDEETKAVSAGSILSDLFGKLQETARFTQAIETLRGKLNATSLQQIIDAGVTGGLATAEALAAGTQEQIDRINAITKTIGTVGGELGSDLSKQFYSAGINAAAAVVEGLRKQGKALDDIAERLATRLVKSVLRQLPDTPVREGRGGAAAQTMGDSRTTARRATAGQAPTQAPPTPTGTSPADINKLVRLAESQNRLLERLLTVEADAPREFAREINNVAANAVRRR